jgi:exonuclease SbcC
LEEAKDKRVELLQETKTYSNLTEAFGKNGIPSYIIEGVVPEIKYVANELVHALTEGRLWVNIQTQKSLKSGETGDTLEIVVADEEGERPYYKYSGGEKFLIDFSIRIALSILLSRRNGCQIETLIIDEGLGSLDEDNRMRFIQALTLASQKFGFKRILLITHTLDVHGFFQNTIEVIKDGSGSRIGNQPVLRPFMVSDVRVKQDKPEEVPAPKLKTTATLTDSLW